MFRNPKYVLLFALLMFVTLVRAPVWGSRLLTRVINSPITVPSNVFSDADT